MTQCSNKRRAAGLAYPRTCSVCGLGPCRETTALNPPEPTTNTVKHTPAIVSAMPSYSGDGYGYGGGALVTFGDITVPFGEGRHAHSLAVEVAMRWNAFAEMLDALKAARRCMADWDDAEYVARVDALISKAEAR